MNKVYLKVIVGGRATGKTLYILDDIYKNRKNGDCVCIGYQEETYGITPWKYYENIFKRGIYNYKDLYYDYMNRFFAIFITFKKMFDNINTPYLCVSNVILTDNLRRDLFVKYNYNAYIKMIHQAYPNAIITIEMTPHEYFHYSSELIPHIVEWRKESNND